MSRSSEATPRATWSASSGSRASESRYARSVRLTMSSTELSSSTMRMCFTQPFVSVIHYPIALARQLLQNSYTSTPTQLCSQLLQNSYSSTLTELLQLSSSRVATVEVLG